MKRIKRIKRAWYFSSHYSVMLISYYVCIYINEQAMELSRVFVTKDTMRQADHLSSQEEIQSLYVSFAWYYYEHMFESCVDIHTIK
jgi:hypothetical protein